MRVLIKVFSIVLQFEVERMGEGDVLANINIFLISNSINFNTNSHLLFQTSPNILSHDLFVTERAGWLSWAHQSTLPLDTFHLVISVLPLHT